MTDYSDLEKKLSKAKVKLMLSNAAFISSVAIQLKHSVSSSVPTAATNGTEVLYNPTFIKNLSEKELVGLMAHETWHVALLHGIRLKNRNPKIWNYAGDYVINILVKEDGLDLPPTDLLDYKYRNMTTEEVYEKLIQEDPDQEPEKNSIGLDLVYGEGQKSEDQETLNKQLENDITEILIKASHQCEALQKGSVPEEIKRKIDQLINPKLSWVELLHRFVDNVAKTDFSWRKPNRRYFPQYHLPTLYSENVENITVAIDTSGSITNEILSKMLSEVKSIYEIFKPNNLSIIDCDCRIHQVHEITDDTDILNLKFTGGGGTSFKPVLKYCLKNPTNVLIYFTDLCGETHLSNDYEYPILWICYSNHKPINIGETIYYDISK